MFDWWPHYGPEYAPAIAWLWKAWGLSCLVSVAAMIYVWTHPED